LASPRSDSLGEDDSFARDQEDKAVQLPCHGRIDRELCQDPGGFLERSGSFDEAPISHWLSETEAALSALPLRVKKSLQMKASQSKGPSNSDEQTITFG